jgi:putative two-component system response regulator
MQNETTRAKILVVDDNTSDATILARLLQEHYDVSVAPSGERALLLASGASKPDLILLDVLMPDMNGYEVLTRLRENPVTRDIPVIFMTGLNSADDEKRGLELGAVDYITKPYSLAIVLARIHTRLELNMSATNWRTRMSGWNPKYPNA